jgi:hypothetical protein
MDDSSDYDHSFYIEQLICHEDLESRRSPFESRQPFRYDYYKNDIDLHRGAHFCRRNCTGATFLCGNSFYNNNGGVTKCGHIAYGNNWSHTCRGSSSLVFDGETSPLQKRNRINNSRSTGSWLHHS